MRSGAAVEGIRVTQVRGRRPRPTCRPRVGILRDAEGRVGEQERGSRGAGEANPRVDKSAVVERDQ